MKLLIFLGLSHVVHTELVFVAGLWTHGDVAPSYIPYPNDLNDEPSWPRGFGALTNVCFSHHIIQRNQKDVQHRPMAEKKIRGGHPFSLTRPTTKSGEQLRSVNRDPQLPEICERQCSVKFHPKLTTKRMRFKSGRVVEKRTFITL
ncbi:unnamed protein product [Strongylus vulgaris]|uniref:Secreted protein n=1 Tax=Strongylus vulgaris TaxID=40348 RepID=A0A3P7J0F1_STRVU|nr:unnamed protein product [Strongylus vulgaris]